MPAFKSPAMEDQLAERIDGSLDTMAEAIANRLGPAPGSTGYSPREIDELWNTKDESVDQQALFAALQQGITPEGAQAVALFRMSPDLKKFAVGTPLQPDQAATIAKLAEYPGRYVLTTGHSSDAAEQVKYVADMHKKQARKMADAAPDDTMQPMSALPTTSEGGGYS